MAINQIWDGRVTRAPARPGRTTPAQPTLMALRRSTVARFLAVGGLSYAVNQAALFLLYAVAFGGGVSTRTPYGRFDVALLVASVTALQISIIVRFLLNDRWTFRARPRKPLGRGFAESAAGSWMAALIALAAVNLLTPAFGWSYLVTNSIGVALGLAWNWRWSDRVVWRGAARRAETNAPLRSY